MTTTAQTLRIRKDLAVKPAADDDGLDYFDVRDPRSGSTMRMYDFEWLIAERIDGRQSLDDVAAWARGRFGWQGTAADLAVYVEKLRELGLVEAEAETERPRAAATADTGPLAKPVAASPVAQPPVPHPVELPRAAEPAPVSHSAPTPALVPSVERVAAAASANPAAAAPPARDALARMVLDEPVHDPTPPVVAPGAPPAKKVDTRVEPKKPAPPEPSNRLVLVLVGLLVLAGLWAIYNYVIGPMFQSTRVSVQTIPEPATVTRFYDGSGGAQTVEPTVLSFEQPGKVVEVVRSGTEVPAGAVLATLDSYQAAERELSAGQKSLDAARQELRTAQSTGDTAAAKTAQGKVTEREARVAALETRVRRTRLTTSSGGTVLDVKVAQGASVKAGEPALRIVDRRLMVEFKLAPSDARAMRAGQPVKLAPAVAPDSAPLVEGRVTQVGVAEVKVQLAEGAKVKAGDALRLVRARFEGVLKIPSSALARHQGGADEVFVDVDGVARARNVTVADRGKDDALVSKGLQAGELLIVSAPEGLQDGQRVTAS